jgi:hypothetical protein
VNHIPVFAHHYLSDTDQITRLTNHTRNESTIDRYRDMMMQNTMTTVVDPSVSLFVGKEIFRNSLFTSFTNSIVDAHIFLNMIGSAF